MLDAMHTHVVVASQQFNWLAGNLVAKLTEDPINVWGRKKAGFRYVWKLAGLNCQQSADKVSG